KLGQNDAVILNYTLQFLKPHLRADFLKKIFFSLRKNSVLILSEKLECAKPINTAITQIYEEYKEAQGYSKLEIAKKKEALNSVLIPLSAKDNEKLCFEAGFSAFECIFRWGNFATFVAIKK
ncbi:MAG: carboxy-S-adenosyl-L-methionine synthase CmoA, partial [Campylobacter sp.]|nr:carboxy-S-adenosyl-L-methionine synthase CmoA [Campylobacter sp.]